MHSLRINISKLPEGVHERLLEAHPQEIGLDERLTQIVRLTVILEKTSRQLYVQVKFDMGGLFSCDRCLDEFEKKIETQFSMIYVTDSQGVSKREEQEVVTISPDTNHIDLDEDVRQFAILALPQKLLCTEECKGLCPTCGTNLNHTICSCEEDELDSRWEGLKKFSAN
ncbi:MAG: DUF177 domain-containing protein [bacterium]